MSNQPTGVTQEHAILTRHLGSVQDRVSRLLCDKESELQTLSSEVVRLRGLLVLSRTSMLWGLSAPLMRAGRRPAMLPSLEQPTAARQEDLEASRKAICQTGCTGHAHHWLSDEGQCRWSGRPCDAGCG
ncbi:hypothetical protein [Hydrogenophaga sp.]|uniref:hypothetical protein n=1 Tax=Hydrogenophaga sp. TaxID=1904254 RepID=UPI002FC99A4D